MKTKTISIKSSVSLLILLLFVLTGPVESRPPDRDKTLLIFEGTVVKIGELPPVGCGVMIAYQLAKYRVDRVYVGDYKHTEIVVDHVACERDVLKGLNPGDKVIVVLNKRETIAQRWNSKGLRELGDKVTVFYIAKRVARCTPL
jgi:hypothetical protein